MKLDIYVQPGAKKSGFTGDHGGRPKIKIAAPPSDGAANEEILRFMAEILRIPKAGVKIAAGRASRMKTLEIETDMDAEEILTLLKEKG